MARGRELKTCSSRKIRQGDWVQEKTNPYAAGRVVKVSNGIVFANMTASLCGLIKLGILEYKHNELVRK